MIVLVGTSQQKYIINTDTLVCYTQDENREIAVTFVEGERDKELFDNCELTVDVLNQKITLLNGVIKVKDQSIIDLQTHYNQVTTIAKDADKVNRKLKFQLVVSKVLIGTLTVLLTLKFLSVL